VGLTVDLVAAQVVCHQWTPQVDLSHQRILAAKEDLDQVQEVKVEVMNIMNMVTASQVAKILDTNTPRVVAVGKDID